MRRGSHLHKETQGNTQTWLPVQAIVPDIPGRRCFTNVSWKNQDVHSRQGWYSTHESFDSLTGAKNTRARQSSFYSEIDALMWEMECTRNLRQFTVTFAIDCSQLVKMLSEPEKWSTFAS